MTAIQQGTTRRLCHAMTVEGKVAEVFFDLTFKAGRDEFGHLYELYIDARFNSHHGTAEEARAAANVGPSNSWRSG